MSPNRPYPSPESSFAKVELYRWQHGQLPPKDGAPLPFNEAAGLCAMADALERCCKSGNVQEMPSPFAVCSVMRYVADKLQEAASKES